LIVPVVVLVFGIRLDDENESEDEDA